MDLRRQADLFYSGYVKDVTSANFGLLIAFVLPGFILLWGMEPYSVTIASWMQSSAEAGTSVGGFLYVTVASVAAGQFVSTLRWLSIDPLLYKTGVPRPKWNFRRLKDSVDAFDRLIEIHYRFYQWHANTFVATTLAAIMRWAAYGFRLSDLVLLIGVDVVLFVGARDTLSKYQSRVEELLYRR